ncbi:hypothetical protein Anas_01592, partial [Armadillidium nasatum]
GVYTIHANNNVKSFEVRDFVLPRFEVTIDSPQTILGSDENVTLQLCAFYVFGEAVKGNATIYASVGNFDTVYANISQTKEIEGCQNFTFKAKELLFDYNNCHISILQVQGNANVTEAGTGVEIIADTTYLTVHRQGITFEDKTINDVKKAYLPALIEIETKYANGTPAINETMESCTFYEDEEICKNFTTDNNGVLYFVIPSQIRQFVKIRAVNFPRIERLFNDVMRESSYTIFFNDFQEYVDPMNTSITIMENMIDCTTGENIEVRIPVVFVATEEFTTDVYLQIQSRGQVIAFKKMSVDFTESDLRIREEDKLIPLETTPEGVILGSFVIPVTLSERASPEISILVWFAKEDGTVVADSLNAVVSECLSHKVDFSWSTPRVGPGEEATLRIKGAENSLCSICVEILSAGNNNDLDISSILSVVYNSIARPNEPQTNLQYCLNKYGLSQTEDEQPVSTPSSTTDSSATSKVSSPISVFQPQIIQALHMFNVKMKEEFVEPAPSAAYDLGTVYKAEAALNEGGATLEEESIQERSYLPETWLWLLRTLS